MRFVNRLKAHFDDVAEVKTDPHSIALGFSIGTFIAILPTFGLNLLLVSLVILVFKKVSKFSILISFLFWNPITLVPIYALSYSIGSLLFGDFRRIPFRVEFLNTVYNLTLRFLVGNFIAAVFFSFLSYFVVRFLFKKNRFLRDFFSQNKKK